jgi:hypothetical protein
MTAKSLTRLPMVPRIGGELHQGRVSKVNASSMETFAWPLFSGVVLGWLVRLSLRRVLFLVLSGCGD